MPKTEQNRSQSNSNVSLKDILEPFKLHLRFELGLSDNTVSTYLKAVQTFAEFLQICNPRTLIQFSRKSIETFLNELHTIGLSDGSKSVYLSAIRQLGQFSVHIGILESNPADEISQKRGQRRIPDALSIDEVDRLLQGISMETPASARDRTIIELLYGSGLRVSEVCDLTLDSINLPESIVTVMGKGNKERIIPLSSSSLSTLENYIIIYRPLFEKSKICENIFLNRYGRKLSRMSIWNIVHDRARVTLPNVLVYPHILRHSFATHLLQGGADLRVIQILLGHSDISTTQIYTHIDTDYLKATLTSYHPRFR